MLTSRIGGVRGLSYSQRYTNENFAAAVWVYLTDHRVRAAAAGLEAGRDDLQHLANTVHRHSRNLTSFRHCPQN